MSDFWNEVDVKPGEEEDDKAEDEGEEDDSNDSDDVEDMNM